MVSSSRLPSSTSLIILRQRDLTGRKLSSMCHVLQPSYPLFHRGMGAEEGKDAFRGKGIDDEHVGRGRIGILHGAPGHPCLEAAQGLRQEEGVSRELCPAFIGEVLPRPRYGELDQHGGKGRS